MPSTSSNRVVIATAGSGKTALLVDDAISNPQRRVLVLTYTEENQRQLRRRIGERCSGVVPPNITVMGWFDFLISQCTKPYQSYILQDVNTIQALNFVATTPKGPARDANP